MKIFNIVVLVLIILIGFWARLYKIDAPVADWHSWRQADTAAVARNFYQEGFNPLVPKYDDMSGVAENPIPNPHRYRFVEFPIYNSLVYFTYILNGGIDEKFARIVSIIFSLGSLVFVYLISKRYFNEITAQIAALSYSILPFNVFFSRVILPEPSLVFFCLGMFYFTDLWINQEKRGLFIVAALFSICAFLTKPYAVFYLLPLIYSYYLKEKTFWPIKKRYWLFAGLIFSPIILWRLWIMQHPEGIPASNWLFNGTHIRFRPAFFRWIVGDRFGREILGVTGTFLFTLGLLVRPRLGENWMMHLFAFSSLMFLIVLATGNVQHDYYQYFIIPALCIMAARGTVLLLSGSRNFIPRIFTIPLGILFFILMIYLGWGQVQGLYQINNGVIVDAGKRADQILPKEAVVLAPYNGDTSFLYQINRPGFPFQAYPLKDLIEEFGVTHLVSVNFDDKTNEAIAKYTILEKTPKYVIIDLTKPI